MSWAVQTHAPDQKSPLLFTTDNFGICFHYIMYNVQKHRRPLMSMESPGTLSIQPASLLAFVILWLLHIRVIQILENMLWVLLHLLMEKERPFPWMVFLGTPINLLQWMNCTDFLGQSSGAWCVNLYTVRSDGLLQSTFSSATCRMPTAGSQNAKMDCTWIYFLCAGKTVWLHMESVWQP